MEDWIEDCAKLIGRWDKVAAGKALVRLSQDREKSTDERLMGYALAKIMLDDVFARYAAEKQTLSEEGSEKLKLAVKLANASIPEAHPLLDIFMREVDFIDSSYSIGTGDNA